MNNVEQKQALRRFHALCGELKLSAENLLTVVLR
jgi:hypothetical protein